MQLSIIVVATCITWLILRGTPPEALQLMHSPLWYRPAVLLAILRETLSADRATQKGLLGSAVHAPDFCCRDKTSIESGKCPTDEPAGNGMHRPLPLQLLHEASAMVACLLPRKQLAYICEVAVTEEIWPLYENARITCQQDVCRASSSRDNRRATGQAFFVSLKPR